MAKPNKEREALDWTQLLEGLQEKEQIKTIKLSNSCRGFSQVHMWHLLSHLPSFLDGKSQSSPNCQKQKKKKKSLSVFEKKYYL